MKELEIVGIFISNRTKEANQVQQLLTKYGCIIKTRLGLHDAFETNCSNNGLIILQLQGDSLKKKNFEIELNKIDGIIIKNMNFEYEE